MTLPHGAEGWWSKVCDCGISLLYSPSFLHTAVLSQSILIGTASVNLVELDLGFISRINFDNMALTS